MLLKNPTPREFARCLLVSQRATWAMLPRIRAACAIEFALDRGVRALRQRLRRLQRQAHELQPQQQEEEQGQEKGQGLVHVPSFYSCRSHPDLQEEAQRHANMHQLSDTDIH